MGARLLNMIQCIWGQREGLESLVNELLWEICENVKDICIYNRVCVYNIKDKFIMMFAVGPHQYGMYLHFTRKKKVV